MKNLIWIPLMLLAVLFPAGCQTISILGPSDATATGVVLPFIKNSPNECYYLDEFMPTPDHMVSGKSGYLTLRYYTYQNATFKDWNKRQITLSFYSVDQKCWSLFEEYYTGDFR